MGEEEIQRIGQPGFEPGTSWSRTKRATNCATARIYTKKPVRKTGKVKNLTKEQTFYYGSDGA